MSMYCIGRAWWTQTSLGIPHRFKVPVKITAAEQNKDKRVKRMEDSLRDLWDNIKRTNIRIIGIPEEEKKKGHYMKFLKILYVLV